LASAKVLVLADQLSHDDFFSTRALTGAGGQRLQAFLKALGVTQSYAIIRTAPVDTLDLSDAARRRVILNAQVSKVRNKILQTVPDQRKTQIIITVGKFAKEAIDPFRNGSVKIFHLDAPTSAASHVTVWNQVLGQIRSQVRGFQGDVASRGNYT